MEVLCPGESLSDGVWFLTAADNTEEDFFFFFPTIYISLPDK